MKRTARTVSFLLVLVLAFSVLTTGSLAANPPSFLKEVMRLELELGDNLELERNGKRVHKLTV